MAMVGAPTGDSASPKTSTTSNGGPSGGKSKQRNMNRYKTELCRAFEESMQCKYDEKCQVCAPLLLFLANSCRGVHHLHP